MTRLAIAVLAAVLLVIPSAADAQRRRRQAEEPTDPLQAAEQAYAEIDFERTLEHAGEALQAGHQPPDRLARIYQLLGVSAAALGDPDGARDFFQRMLAIDADAELDDTVPPRLRAPYLEARGIVSARSDRLAVEVGLARAQASVRVALTDPFQMARTLRVHARIEGAVEFTTIESEAMAEVLAPLPGADTADRIEYWVEVIDPYDNQLLLAGSEFEPRTVGRPAVAVVEGGVGGGGPVTPHQPSIAEEPLFWVALIGGVAVVGAAIGIGVGVDAASHVPVQTGVRFGVD